jgi:hypothetical protein
MAEMMTNESGVLPTLISSGANLTEKAMAVPLGLIKTVRDEVFSTASASVDWVEGMSQSSFRIAREILKRVDLLSLAAVEGLDSIAGSFTRAVRESGVATGEMVSKTAASFASQTQMLEHASKQVTVPAA